jgi:hypothetical protein
MTIRSALRLAVKDGLLLSNPAEAVEPLGTEDSETREPFSLVEVEALFAAAPDAEWRALMHIAFYRNFQPESDAFPVAKLVKSMACG